MPCTSPLKIRSEISGEFSRISTAATRPLPSADAGIRRCEMKRAQVERQVHQQLAGAALREEVDDAVSAWLALLACSVAMHRWPVSAKAMA